LLGSVADGDTVVGAAFSALPRVLILSRMSEISLTTLADLLAAAGHRFPGVVGPADSPATFARLWSQSTRATSHLYMRQMIHSCREACRPQRAAGDFRAAESGDVPQLARWWVAFNQDVGNTHIPDNPAAEVQRMIDESRLYVWDDGGAIVSCAAIVRWTPQGAVIAFVYTPPDLRGRGYATSCVAELTDRQLRNGREFCCLYTDLANPTSNAIYTRIGYRPVCGAEWWEFGES